MFKKGDKVRRINCNYTCMTESVYVGEIYTVIWCERTDNGKRHFSVKLAEKAFAWDGFYFELIDDFPELLKKAKLIRRLGEKLLDFS